MHLMSAIQQSHWFIWKAIRNASYCLATYIKTSDRIAYFAQFWPLNNMCLFLLIMCELYVLTILYYASHKSLMYQNIKHICSYKTEHMFFKVYMKQIYNMYIKDCLCLSIIFGNLSYFIWTWVKYFFLIVVLHFFKP